MCILLELSENSEKQYFDAHKRDCKCWKVFGLNSKRWASGDGLVPQLLVFSFKLKAYQFFIWGWFRTKNLTNHVFCWQSLGMGLINYSKGWAVETQYFQSSSVAHIFIDYRNSWWVWVKLYNSFWIFHGSKCFIKRLRRLIFWIRKDWAA